MQMDSKHKMLTLLLGKCKLKQHFIIFFVYQIGEICNIW